MNTLSSPWDQFNSQSAIYSVGKSVSKSTNQSINQYYIPPVVCFSVTKWDSHPLVVYNTIQTLLAFPKKGFSMTMTQLVCLSFSHFVSLSVCEPICLPSSQPVSQPVIQLIYQSIHLSISQLVTLQLILSYFTWKILHSLRNLIYIIPLTTNVPVLSPLWPDCVSLAIQE